MQPFLFAFGLFQHNIEQIKELDQKIEDFRLSNKEAVFVLYLGVVNHWVTLIAYKDKSDNNIQFYLLDSSNLVFLDKADQQLPEVMEKRAREKEAIGLKKSSPFMIKMCIQSLFDMRRAFEIIIETFNGKSKIAQYYSSGFVHNVLK